MKFPIPNQKSTSNKGILLLSLAIALSSCAVPTMPPGGPPDQTPPSITESTPAADAVNVEASSLRISFSEYVDQASFARAFSITPLLNGRLDYKWRKRSVEVRFPEALRENTTYIITIDTDFKDANGVSLRQPITLAFSTGPIINQGRIAGQVLSAKHGKAVANFDVFAYATPDSTLLNSLPENPDYRTQTDEDGQFTFSYLSEQPYFVIALQDLNRNRQPDPTEAFAAPPHPVFFADTVATPIALPWLATTLDTIPPFPQRVRSLSSRRHSVRFSEAVHLTTLELDNWLLLDSLTSQSAAIQAIYMLPDDPQQVYLLTDALREVTHLLRPAAVADSSNNSVLQDTLWFIPSSDPDTLQSRFQKFLPERGLSTDEDIKVLPASLFPGIQLNQTVPAIGESTTLQDTTSKTIIPFTTTTTDGSSYAFQPTLPLSPDQTITLTVDGQSLSNTDTLYVQAFRRISEQELGSLSGYATTDSPNGGLIVQLFEEETSSEPVQSIQPDSTGQFFFSNLPEGSYRYRVFLDLNENGIWDRGQVLPYQAAEPLTWNTESLTWRAKWDSALEDTLRIELQPE